MLQEGLHLPEGLQALPLAREFEVLLAVSGLRRPRVVHAAPPPSSPLDDYGLTPREREVLPLLTVGATNRTIARTLYISERTASVHVSNILTKLGVVNRTEAARKAIALRMDTGTAREETP